MSDNCRCCGGKNLECVVSLGVSPLANNLLNSIDSEDTLYPLEVLFCKDCSYCQLSVVVPPSLMFDNYLYVSSTAKSFRDHFKQAAEKYIKEFNLTSDSLVVDIGSNDGIFLKPLKEAGVSVVGVDPAVNIAKLSNDNGIDTINAYFNSESADEILLKYGKADIVTASNVFAHSAEIDSITENAFKLLKPNGCFIIEVQYVADTINDMTFDNIYHEHVSYWSVTSMNNFFNKRGYSVVDVEHVDTHGGSIRVYVKTNGNEISDTVAKFLEFESKFGLTHVEIYRKFFEQIQKIKNNVVENLELLKKNGKKIAGYGSPAKATTSLNYYGVGTDYIDYIVEDNKLKHNKYIPGVKIPIFSKDKLKENKPDIIVIMAWNFANEIKKNNQDLIDSGIEFISIKDLETNV